MLDAVSANLGDYRSEHRELMAGSDGEYEIDVTARFSALNMDFLVLVECKYHKNPIKREVIQALHSKMLSVGAHKAAVFSTSGFQSGALEYALAHGIATIKVEDGRSCYFTRSMEPTPEPPSWANIPAVIGWLICGQNHSLVSAQHGEYLSATLGFEADEI
jgi:restriction system protein